MSNEWCKETGLLVLKNLLISPFLSWKFNVLLVVFQKKKNPKQTHYNIIMYLENDLNLNNGTYTNQSFLMFLNFSKFNLLNSYLFVKVLWAILLKPHCTKIAWASVNCYPRVSLNQLISRWKLNAFLFLPVV